MPSSRGRALVARKRALRSAGHELERVQAGTVPGWGRDSRRPDIAAQVSARRRRVRDVSGSHRVWVDIGVLEGRLIPITVSAGGSRSRTSRRAPRGTLVREPPEARGELREGDRDPLFPPLPACVSLPTPLDRRQLLLGQGDVVPASLLSTPNASHGRLVQGVLPLFRRHPRKGILLIARVGAAGRPPSNQSAFRVAVVYPCRSK